MIKLINSKKKALSSIKSFREFLNSLLKNCADLKSKNDPISLNLIVQLQKILTSKKKTICTFF